MSEQPSIKRRARYLVTAISPSGNPFSSAFDADDEADAVRKLRDYCPGAYLPDQPITARLSKWK
jgi:hypothetical protein